MFDQLQAMQSIAAQHAFCIGGLEAAAAVVKLLTVTCILYQDSQTVAIAMLTCTSSCLCVIYGCESLS